MTGTDSTLRMEHGVLMSKRKSKPKDRVEMLPFATLVFESPNGEKYEAQIPLGEKRVVEVTPKRKKKKEETDEKW